jgi:hypothetical protein
VPGGSSPTTSCHWPRARSSIFQRAHLQAAAAAGVGGADVFRAADDLAATGEVGARDQRGKLVVGELLVLQQRHRGGGHLAQVVAGHLGGQAHGDAAGAVEQHEGQPRRQQARLLRRAVVVGDEVDRAFVDLVEQQARDRRQARLGVAHRRGTVAVAAAEVALPVDQRVALAEVLRHAHQRVVGGLVAMRVEAAEHVADHARALHRLRAGRRGEGQAHALHGVEDAALHRLLAIAHIGQRAALDHAERVFQVGLLGVQRQRDGVAFGRRGRIEEVVHARRERSVRPGRRGGPAGTEGGILAQTRVRPGGEPRPRFVTMRGKPRRPQGAPCSRTSRSRKARA